MAIIGLKGKLAERGKIKIGERGDKKESSGGKYGPPKKLDHFIITTLERDAAGRFMLDAPLMDRIKKEQKVEKLKEIPIRLLFDENELNFSTSFSCYKKTMVKGKERLGCWCSGDNKNAMRLNEKGEYEEVPCPCERQNPFYGGADKCRYMGTLQCLIEGTNRVGGVWQFRTGSKNTVESIIGSMNMIKTVTGGGQVDPDGNPVGPLAWIPLKMMVSPKSTISPEGQPVIIHVVRLEFDGLDERLTQLGYEIMRKRIEHGMNMGKLQKQQQRLLVAPYQEEDIEQVETAQEFFHEAVAAPGDKPTIERVAKEEASKDAPEVAATSSEGATSEPSAEATSQSQEEEVQKPKPMTIPEVIEACQANKFIPVFPIPLVTTKGVAIGEWVGRKMDKMELQAIHVVFEMLPNMTKETGLTKDRISKSFNEAGYRVKFQEPGTMKQALAQEEAVIPPAEQVQAKASNNNGGKSKSLF